MVTLLTPLPLDPELEAEPEPEPVPEPEAEPEPDPVDDEPLLWELVPEVAVVEVGVDATVLTDDVVDVLLASAGSWPETSTIAIISQAATNSATAPEMARRRICRARAARAPRRA